MTILSLIVTPKSVDGKLLRILIEFATFVPQLTDIPSQQSASQTRISTMENIDDGEKWYHTLYGILIRFSFSRPLQWISDKWGIQNVSSCSSKALILLTKQGLSDYSRDPDH